MKVDFQRPWGEGEYVKTTAVMVRKAGYEVRTEDYSETYLSASPGFVMKIAYNPQGDYIGTAKDAYFLCVTKGITPILSSPGHNVCSIGFSTRDGKWYGWSHRAIHGYAVGDEFKQGKIGFDILPGFQAECLEDAKLMAMIFAEDVS